MGWFTALLGSAKAVEGVSNVLNKAGELVDDWGYTKEERARDEKKRSEDYNKFMALTDTVAQQIRSQTRAKIVKLVVYPYVGGWIATFPMMIMSVLYPQFSGLLDLLHAWLKMFTPIVAAFGGGYIGYYGVQTIMSTVRRNENGKKSK